MTPLPLPRVGAGADVAAEAGHVADQEGSESEPLTSRPAGALRAELELTRAVRVARNAQVIGATNVDAELNRVSPHRLQHIADELQLFLLLIEGAVAAVDSQSGAEVEAAIALHKAAEQARAEFVEVQARDARVGRRGGAEVERQHVDSVLEVPEAKIEHRRLCQR